eukprot:scaffold164_cov105-Isochrysis_galbana.AAC.5
MPQPCRAVTGSALPRPVPLSSSQSASPLQARNIPYLTLSTLDNINARDIIKAKKVIIAQSALDVIKERYA